MPHKQRDPFTSTPLTIEECLPGEYYIHPSLVFADTSRRLDPELKARIEDFVKQRRASRLAAKNENLGDVEMSNGT